jgi:hypothetical protein
MATIRRVLNQLENNGWEKQELDELETRTVVRNFFRADTIYGGAADQTGKFDARKIGIIIKEKDGTEKKRLIWAVCYIVTITQEDGTTAELVQDALTKSFLLSSGRYDVDNNHIQAIGDVREWADTHIVNNVLEKEWTAALAKSLNERGLILIREEYKQPKKDGGWFAAHIDHPHFADTYKAE